MKFIKTNTLPLVGISHNEDIKKKVFLEKGYIPQLMTFGQATFKPGQRVEPHVHQTMYEVFYIQTGRAEFVIEGKTYVVEPGDCISVDQGEEHMQSNPFDEDVMWIYFGIATD